VLVQALKWGLVIRNVADLVDAPSVKRKAPVTFTPGQVKIFLESVRGNRFYPIYVLAFAGLREGELLGLHVEDVDMENHIINVRHAVQYLIGKGLVITEPKTDSSKRAVKLPDFIWVVLKKHLDSLKRNQGLIFTTGNGTPFSPRNLIRDFKECLTSAGLPEIRFHDLRHTTASLLLSQGVHPKVVQEMLGHSQISLTMDTYSHVLPGLQDEAATKMNGILSGIKA
jgi:integrase